MPYTETIIFGESRDAALAFDSGVMTVPVMDKATVSVIGEFEAAGEAIVTDPRYPPMASPDGVQATVSVAGVDGWLRPALNQLPPCGVFTEDVTVSARTCEGIELVMVIAFVELQVLLPAAADKLTCELSDSCNCGEPAPTRKVMDTTWAVVPFPGVTVMLPV